MQYIGEHLLPGQLGHFFTLLSLIASLLATAVFYKASRVVSPIERKSWLRLGRIVFLVETISVFSVFALLYFIISHHYHEYFFAWNHSSRSLLPKYLLACIWEDQSGSFLLWSIWHCVLGWILIWRAKQWEAGTLTVISFAQFCIATMLIGMYFFGQKVGSDPFILWRQQMPELPLFADPHYLQLPRVFEGNDLNTLLQNYWMVIHPPILFLGFASTIVPFAFAYAGLRSSDHSWAGTALPWASFSGAILGTGIMMGAAWAYESLSFGGYWAWDPVENASLVPWITLVAGLHTNLVYNRTGYSLRSTYFFYIITFTLVLYSTFLTRSGILGDTSVHAFTGADMTLQLILFAAVFFIPAIILFFRRYKKIPSIRREESSYSREFWMFIGSMVLFLSALVIIARTSLPVFNKIFGSNIAAPEDPKYAHNQVQIFVCIIIGILTGTTQYFRYKDTPPPVFRRRIIWPVLVALLIGAMISLFGHIDYNEKTIAFLIAIHAAIFSMVYAVVANAGYIFTGLKGKLRLAGASVAHVGFGLALIGILISSSKKKVLSWNTTGIAFFKKSNTEDPAENITLFKSLPTDMGPYNVTYVSDTFNTAQRKRFYGIQFQAKDSSDSFTLYPDLIRNNKGVEGMSANPDSKHYWNKDIFVYISAAEKNDKEDTATFRPREIKAGDTSFYRNGFFVLNRVVVNPPDQRKRYVPGENAIFLDMTVVSKEGHSYPIMPGIAVKDMDIRSLPDSVKPEALAISFNKVIDQKTGRLEIGVKESSAITDLITLKVYEFPMINLLWIGVLIMVAGFLMSVISHLKKRSLTVA